MKPGEDILTSSDRSKKSKGKDKNTTSKEGDNVVNYDVDEMIQGLL